MSTPSLWVSPLSPFRTSWILIQTLLIDRHRPSLLKYHNRHLRLGESQTAAPGSPLASTSSLNLKVMGLGMSSISKKPTISDQPQGYQLTILDAGTEEEKLELDSEIERLEAVLEREVEEWEVRLKNINEELRGKK